MDPRLLTQSEEFVLVQPLLKEYTRILNGFPSWRGYNDCDSFEHVD